LPDADYMISNGAQMKAVGYQKPLPIDDPNALLDIEVEAPIPSKRDLLVRVQAISVNPVDTKIRKRAAPPAGEYKILGWDAVGIVEAVGEDVTMFAPGDRVWYAGAVNRQGANAELHVVDERITSHAPDSLDDAHAAALPLTSITAWELLFERLTIPRAHTKNDATLLIVGAAGGVGSILTQLATKLTGATVIATASRDASRQWLEKLGAHYIINHNQPLLDQIRQLGIDNVSHVASINRSDLHLPGIVEAMAPFGKLAMIDDPGEANLAQLKNKSISLHWEFMFTRSLFETNDMIEQHRLLNEIAKLLDEDVLVSSFAENFGVINAENLKRAHALIESGQSRGKIILQGFQP
jgi:zinc-binding alcohol dehydrogenase family protein